MDKVVFFFTRKDGLSRDEFHEPLAWDEPTRDTLGSSLLFTARDFGKPMPFTPPKWARKIDESRLRFRPVSSWEYGYWWIEWGGHMNTIRDNERIRFDVRPEADHSDVGEHAVKALRQQEEDERHVAEEGAPCRDVPHFRKRGTRKSCNR